VKAGTFKLFLFFDCIACSFKVEQIPLLELVVQRRPQLRHWTTVQWSSIVVCDTCWTSPIGGSAAFWLIRTFDWNAVGTPGRSVMPFEVQVTPRPDGSD